MKDLWCENISVKRYNCEIGVDEWRNIGLGHVWSRANEKQDNASHAYTLLYRATCVQLPYLKVRDQSLTKEVRFLKKVEHSTILITVCNTRNCDSRVYIDKAIL